MNEPQAIFVADVLSLSIGMAAGYVLGFGDGWTSRRFLSTARRAIARIRRAL